MSLHGAWRRILAAIEQSSAGRSHIQDDTWIKTARSVRLLGDSCISRFMNRLPYVTSWGICFTCTARLASAYEGLSWRASRLPYIHGLAWNGRYSVKRHCLPRLGGGAFIWLDVCEIPRACPCSTRAYQTRTVRGRSIPGNDGTKSAAGTCSEVCSAERLCERTNKHGPETAP